MSANATKINLVIADSLNQRLDFEAAVRGKGHDRSSIVEDLVRAHISLPEAVGEILTQPAGVKSPGSQPLASVARSKTTFYLTGEAARRLQLHMTWTGEDRSKAVERLIRDYVTPWGVYDPRMSYVSAKRRDRQAGANDVNQESAAA